VQVSKNDYLQLVSFLMSQMQVRQNDYLGDLTAVTSASKPNEYLGTLTAVTSASKPKRLLRYPYFLTDVPSLSKPK
jgi:hypothetical protein